MMPVLDGYQVLEQMKLDTELRDIPVIMISAIDEVDSVIRCVELGAADYLTKPFNPTLLKARVDTYLEKAHYRAQEAAYFKRMEAEKKRADELLGIRRWQDRGCAPSGRVPVWQSPLPRALRYERVHGKACSVETDRFTAGIRRT